MPGVTGSPPRVRELRYEQTNVEFFQGITPACAGITGTTLLPTLATWDHPRVCGNYLHQPGSLGGVPGSPPRVRELPRTYTAKRKGSWITPACAGITFGYPRRAGTARDHPRVCGNYLIITRRLTGWLGSPPRVRELPYHCIKTQSCFRITPACAGITMHIHASKNVIKDHPRVCGNYTIQARKTRDQLGSPPRVRELLDGTEAWSAGTRITPACAGITWRSRCIIPTRRDHPRVCGNYCSRPKR